MKIIDIAWDKKPDNQRDWEKYSHWLPSRGRPPVNGCWNFFWGRNKLRQCLGNHYWPTWISKCSQDGFLVFSSKIRNNNVSRRGNGYWHATKLKGRCFYTGLLLAMKLGCIITPWNPNKPVWNEGRRKNLHPSKPKLDFQLEKFLQLYFLISKESCRFFSQISYVVYYCQFLNETKLAYCLWHKRELVRRNSSARSFAVGTRMSWLVWMKQGLFFFE